MTTPELITFIRIKAKNRVYLWKCFCGTYFMARKSEIKSKNTRSCGCLRNVKNSLTVKEAYTYTVYKGMLRRCYNSNHIHYEAYGGRGISVYFDWMGKDGFLNFILDMGRRQFGMSIERKDVDGHYEPANCIWLPRNEQWKNKRKSRR